MADFGIKPDIALGVKPAPTMSLGDLVNLGRSVQAYKQAEIINPLAAQKAQEELSQAQTKTTSDAMRLDINRANQIAAGSIALINDPDVIRAEAGEPFDKEKLVNKVVNHLKLQSQNAGIDWQTKGRELAAPYIDIAQNRPQELRAFGKTRHIVGLDDASRTALLTGQMVTSGGQPALANPFTGTITPLQAQEQNAPATPAQQQGATPLPFPVRKPGTVAPFRIGEEDAIKRGQTYVADTTNAQLQNAQTVRNLDETLKVVEKLNPGSFWSSGLAGAFKRKASELIGDTTYRQLSKDLANLQISNIKSAGGSMDTVAGQQLARYASGDETYPPDVLENIIKRTYSDAKNNELAAKGAALFSDKFGFNNIDKFKRDWSKNSDSRIFEAMVIAEKIKDKTELNKALNNLLGADRKTNKSLQEKYDNIIKLSTQGSL